MDSSLSLVHAQGQRNPFQAVHLLCLPSVSIAQKVVQSPPYLLLLKHLLLPHTSPLPSVITPTRHPRRKKSDSHRYIRAEGLDKLSHLEEVAWSPSLLDSDKTDLRLLPLAAA